jgi:hypothetical protein
MLGRFAAFCLSLLLASTALAGAKYTPIKRVFKPGAKDPGPDSVAVIAHAPHMNAAEYHDLKAASLVLLKKFSPASHYFVFLGRDAAPISAFMQNLGGHQLAVNFPAASNHANNDTPEVMSKYVDRFIPKEALRGDRKIVVVDASATGRGLDYWVPKLQPHLPGVEVIKAVYLVTGGTLHIPGNKTVFSTSAFPEVDKYFGGDYENVIAEYPRHVPGYHPVADIAQPRPEWTQFRQAVMKRMEADTELDQALTQIGGVQRSARRRAASVGVASSK